MKCFYHPTLDAVAICKSCNRGLCAGCAAPVGTGIACRGSCEEDVQAINEMLARSRKSFSNASTAYVRTALFYALMGTVFTGLGAFSLNSGGWVMLLIGIGMFVGAVLYFSMSRKYKQP